MQMVAINRAVVQQHFQPSSPLGVSQSSPFTRRTTPPSHQRIHVSAACETQLKLRGALQVADGSWLMRVIAAVEILSAL